MTEWLISEESCGREVPPIGTFHRARDSRLAGRVGSWLQGNKKREAFASPGSVHYLLKSRPTARGAGAAGSSAAARAGAARGAVPRKCRILVKRHTDYLRQFRCASLAGGVQEQKPRAFESEVVVLRAHHESVFTQQSYGLWPFNREQRKFCVYVDRAIAAHFEMELAKRAHFRRNQVRAG